MVIRFDLIPFNSEAYREALGLREQVLRKPLDLTLNEGDMINDSKEYHLGAFNQQRLVGCVSLRPISASVVKLRQMAVEPNYRGQGVGSQLLCYAEKIACNRNFKEIEMHARYKVKGFYEKFGYHSEGESFMEVTIPHILMRKKLAHKTSKEKLF
jgi:predicted GNAT family N-acyltransferase